MEKERIEEVVLDHILIGINRSESSVVTVYRAENFYSFSATAKPLAPSGVEWIACRS